MPPNTLYAWFAAALERDPSAIAVEVGTQQITYRDLAERADRVASSLMAGRRSAPVRVALAAERSVGAYAAYLAIQRIGAGIVPLNPRHPSPRNLEIVQEAGIETAVVTSGSDDPFRAAPRRFRPASILVGDGRDVIVEGPDGGALPPVPDDPDAQAYIVFTSGSQGRPKGVPVTQATSRPSWSRASHGSAWDPTPGSRSSSPSLSTRPSRTCS